MVWETLGLPRPTQQQRISGYACRYLALLDPISHNDSTPPLVVRGLLWADAKQSQSLLRRTVMDVDGKLVTCILDEQLRQPRDLPRMLDGKKRLFGHSDRLVAVVVAYLCMRLAVDDEHWTLQAVAKECQVDMQSLQQCKANLIPLIDPALWE